ncbi:hypothetical protein KCP73_04050 [Salmonella enterica subsp. enterica]|nr:hypothetical protein KCP73_04050 [Salmonella enterica subsp. enterica]
MAAQRGAIKRQALKYALGFVVLWYAGWRQYLTAAIFARRPDKRRHRAVRNARRRNAKAREASF